MSVWPGWNCRCALCHEPRRTFPGRHELPAGGPAAALGMGHVVGPDHRALASRGLAARAEASARCIDIAQHFGLDPYQQFWFSTTDPTIEATQHHVEGIVANMDDYRRIRPQLFPCHDAAIAGMAAWAERQRRGEAVVWCTLEGFFWFPRTLMGFEKLMLAFYDQPELLHRDQPRPARVQPRPAGQDPAGVRADVHDHRRGHVLQPRADDLEADVRRSSSLRIIGSSCRGCWSAGSCRSWTRTAT